MWHSCTIKSIGILPILVQFDFPEVGRAKYSRSKYTDFQTTQTQKLPGQKYSEFQNNHDGTKHT